MQGRNKKCSSVLVILKGKHHFRDVDTDEKLMLNCILPKIGYKNVDKDYVAQECPTLRNTVLYL
jgi:hypothetical protein